jgi:O-antigen/teichoic acid export membrane protein
MSNVIKSSYYYTIANVLPQSIGFLFLPIYSIYMTPSDFGVVAAMETVAYIFSVIVCLSLDRAAQRFYFDGDIDYQKKMLSTFFISTLLLSLLFVVVCLAIKPFLQAVFVSIPFYPYFMLSIASVSLNSLSLITTLYYQVSEQPRIYMALKVVRFISQIFLTLIFVVWLLEGAKGQLIAELISVSLFIPVYLIIAHKNFGWYFDKAILIKGVSYSWPFIPTLLMAWVLNLSDRVFLERYIGLEDLGVYSMGYKVSMAFFVFSSALTMAYTPVFYRLANSENQTYAKSCLSYYSKLTSGVFIFLTFFMALFSKEIFDFFLDSRYQQGYNILRIVIFGHLLSAIMGVTSVLYILQAKKTKLNMLIAIQAAFVNVILNFLLIPSYGVYGAAIATLLSLIILTTLQYHFSKNAYFIRFPWGKVSIIIGFLAFVLMSYHFYIEMFGIISIVSKLCILLVVLWVVYLNKHQILGGKFSNV